MSNLNASTEQSNTPVNCMAFKARTAAPTLFIEWYARGNAKIPAGTFVLREGGEKVETDAFDDGVIMDFRHIHLGMQRSEGIAGVKPEWRWADDPRDLSDKPDGDGWKSGFRIPCVLPDGRVAIWEQAGAGAFNGILDFQGRVWEAARENLGKIPKVRMTGKADRRFKKGATSSPVLETVDWVDPPEELGGDSLLPKYSPF